VGTGPPARASTSTGDTLSLHTRARDAYGYFDQIVEEENPLITSETAEKAVEELRERGMSYRQIARLGGVSV